MSLSHAVLSHMGVSSGLGSALGSGSETAVSKQQTLYEEMRCSCRQQASCSLLLFVEMSLL